VDVEPDWAAGLPRLQSNWAWGAWLDPIFTGGTKPVAMCPLCREGKAAATFSRLCPGWSRRRRKD